MMASVLDTAIRGGPPSLAQQLVEGLSNSSSPGVALMTLGFVLLGLYHLSLRGLASVFSAASMVLLMLSLLYAAWTAGGLLLDPHIAVVTSLILASLLLFAAALARVPGSGGSAGASVNMVLRLLTGWAAALTVYIVAAVVIAAPLEVYERCVLEVCDSTAFYVLGGFLYVLAASPPLFAVSAYLYAAGLRELGGPAAGPEGFEELGLLGKTVIAAVVVLALYTLFRGSAVLLVPLAAVVMVVAGMLGFLRGRQRSASTRLVVAGTVVSLALVSLAVFVPAVLVLVSGAVALSEGKVLTGGLALLATALLVFSLVLLGMFLAGLQRPVLRVVAPASAAAVASMLVANAVLAYLSASARSSSFLEELHGYIAGPGLYLFMPLAAVLGLHCFLDS